MRKLFLTLLFTLVFISVFTQSFAVTEKQKDVGEAIAKLAIDVSTNNETDFGYSFYFGLDSEGNPKIMESVMSQRDRANYAGIKYSGYIYGSTPASAGKQGFHENKFIVHCASYARFLIYHATSKDGVYPELEHGERKFEALLPGDIVSVKQVTERNYIWS